MDKKWFNPSKKLPENDDPVIVLYKAENYFTKKMYYRYTIGQYIRGNENFWLGMGLNNFNSSIVVAWRPFDFYRNIKGVG